MIHSVRFTTTHRCFNEGELIEFRAGVNLLVGDQGVGKSSLLYVIRGQGKAPTSVSVAEIHVDPKTSFKALDFERDNPRIKGHFGEAALFQVQAHFASHGEVARVLLTNLATLDCGVIILDEPDTAMSPRSAHWLAKELKTAAKKGKQILAAVHNPIIIESMPEVLSLEHRRWMSSAEFLESHKRPQIPLPEKPPPRKRIRKR